MSSQPEQERVLLCNLQDAGCPPDVIEAFAKCRKEENRQKQLRILLSQRRRLLDQVHEAQHRLECLDYLIYRIRKKEEENV